MQGRFSRLEDTRAQIVAQPVAEQSWFREVVRKLDYLLEKFLLFGAKEAQFQNYLMRLRAAELFDRGEPCGPEANMAKLLAADASWEAANVAMQTYGGYGLAVDYDIERKFRETRLYQVAPISTNLILAYVGEHVLGLPRSF